MKYKTVKIPEELYHAVNLVYPGDNFDWKLEMILKDYLEEIIEKQDENTKALKQHLTAFCNEKIAQRTEYKPDF